MDKELIRVASYCRVSTDKEDQANSFTAQQRYFREYIRRRPDWVLYEVYADEGITGTSTEKRTQFNRMIRDASMGKFQLILTKEVSRFSRNILDTIRYTRELKSIGVGVLFLTENLNTLNPESEMLLTFMGTIAQEESRRTSIRVKWGQTRQMEQGVVFGPSMLGYDVNNGRITPNPEGAELVRLIFHKYGIEKKGTSVISRELQEAGFRTFSGGAKWNSSHIVKILRNEKYAGDLVQKKTITTDYLTHRKKRNAGEEPLVILKNHHEPIVSRELWDTVQAELKRRDRHTEGQVRSTRCLFSGKIYCGECGSVFVRRQKQRSDGTIIHRWCCGTAAAEGLRGCAVGKLLREDDALQMLKTALEHLQLDTEAVVSHVGTIACGAIQAGEWVTREELSRLQRENGMLERKKEGLMDAYFSGDLSRSEMLNMKSRYDSQLNAIQKRMDAIRNPPGVQPPVLEELLMILTAQRDSEAFYRTILNKITVFKDRHMELTMNHLPLVFRFAEQDEASL